jgi:hypothetical protein
MKEATKIVVNGEQGLNLDAKAFLLIDWRFHCFQRCFLTSLATRPQIGTKLH